MWADVLKHGPSRAGGAGGSRHMAIRACTSVQCNTCGSAEGYKVPSLLRSQRQAAALGVALVCPDTSPRGLNVPGEADSWDFGVGAGFYVNATQERWRNWRMYAYVTEELPAALRSLPALSVDTVRPRDAPPLAQYDKIPCQKEPCIASRSSGCTAYRH